MPKCLIRRLIHNDCEAVADLCKQLPKQLRWGEQELYEALEDHDRHEIHIVAVVGRQVVGFLAVEIKRKHHRLITVVVDEPYRRKGIARLMYATAERLTAKVGYPPFRHVRTAATDDLLPAHLWLRKVGFQCFKTEKDTPEEGSDLYHFERFYD